MKSFKKFCLTALCCVMLSSITIQTVHSASEKNTYVRGDANDDGKVTIADVVAIQRNLLGSSATPFSKIAANVDCKGGVKLSDAIYVQKYLIDNENNTHYIGSVFDLYELPFIHV